MFIDDKCTMCTNKQNLLSECEVSVLLGEVSKRVAQKCAKADETVEILKRTIEIIREESEEIARQRQRIEECLIKKTGMEGTLSIVIFEMEATTLRLKSIAKSMEYASDFPAVGVKQLEEKAVIMAKGRNENVTFDKEERVWLKEKRIEKGISQQNVAEKIGVTQQYYNLIEKGKRKKGLDVQLITKLSDIFGLSVEEIVELEKE